MSQFPPDISSLLVRSAGGQSLQPSEIGELIDHFKQRDLERLEANRKAEEATSTADMLKQAVIAQLKRSNVTIGGGRQFLAELTIDEVPRVTDWEKFYAHVAATNSFDLLERRPGKVAFRERWQAGEVVPGTEKFPVDKLSIRKLKGS